MLCFSFSVTAVTNGFVLLFVVFFVCILISVSSLYCTVCTVSASFFSVRTAF